MQRRGDALINASKVFQTAEKDYGPVLNIPEVPEDRLPRKQATLVEVRYEATSKVKGIYHDWHLLRNIVRHWGPTIENRWTKKGNNKRRAILLDVHPNMPESHRPDFKAHRAPLLRLARGLGFTNADTQSTPRDAYLCPHINQADLLGARTFLILLSARVRLQPGTFAMPDARACKLGRTSKKLRPSVLTDPFLLCDAGPHVMLLGATNENQYGNLIFCEDEAEAARMITSGVHYALDTGLLVLEAEQRMLSFLLDCCRAILHDVLRQDHDPATENPDQLQTFSIDDSSDNEPLTLALVAKESSYRDPSHISLETVTTVLAARESAAADHLWMLRESPLYFQEQLILYQQHQLEMLQDDKREPRTKQSTQDFWNRVVQGLVLQAFLRLETFSELRRQADQLLYLQKQVSGDSGGDGDLTETYLSAVLVFRTQSAYACMELLRAHEVCTPCSPYWRELFQRSTIEYLNQTGQMERTMKQFSALEAEVFVAMYSIWRGTQDPAVALFETSDAMEELSRMVNEDEERQKMFSDLTSELFMDAAVINECRRQMRAFESWVKSCERANKPIQSTFFEDLKKWLQGPAALANLLKQMPRLGALADPSGNKFYYPINLARTKANTDVLRQAESNLDAFWAEFDAIMASKAQDIQGTATRQVLDQKRSLLRTAEWVAPERGTFESSPASTTHLHQQLTDLHIAASAINGLKAGKGPAAAEPKVKVKTKRQSDTTIDSPVEAPVLDPTTTDKPKKILVDKRAYAVFTKLFYNPSATATPGDLPWKDFLHAMTAATSVNFAAEHIWGSVWQFRPRAGGASSSAAPTKPINFHEPHPRKVIDYWKARIIGRRLERAYGWGRESFEVRVKEANGE